MPPREESLRGLQRWMCAVLTGPATPTPSSSRASKTQPRRRILPSATLAPEERLEIYAQMMRERFVACLERDFPATCAFLGAERFRELALAYALARPSRHYNLVRYGDRFARFVALRASADAAPASELAQLEWALSESFDAPQAPPLDAEALVGASATRAGEHRISVAPAVRLLDLNYSIVEIYRTCIAGERPARPRRRRTRVLVHRTGFQVRFREIDGSQLRALQALRGSDAPLSKAVRLAARGLAGSPETRLRALRERFAKWTSLGLLATAARKPCASRILRTTAR